MKIIKYNICQAVNLGTEENPQMLENLFSVEMDWSEINEETAKKEAYNGEYIIEDDGRPEPESEPSADEILNALLGVK